MPFAKWIVLALTLPITGCALFESLARGLGTLAVQAEGQPDMYVARKTTDGVDTRFAIDRVTVVRAREGAPDDVLYEGWRRDFQQVEAARADGQFRDLSLRNDGQRLAGILEEDLSDTTEYFALLYTAPGGRELLEISDNFVARTVFELCFDASLVADDLDQYLRDEEFIADGISYEATWDFEASGGPIGEWYVDFRGWTQDGNAVFFSEVGYDADVVTDLTTFNDIALGEQIQTTVTFANAVVYSATTGTPIECYDGTPLVAPADPIFDVRTQAVSASTGFRIVPPGGGVFTLFNFPSGVPPQRLLFRGDVDDIALPSR